MKNRIQLVRLEFVGDEKLAEISFTEGLNVIHGKSNTGKSLVLLSLQYVFGKNASTEFAGIEELNGYRSIRLKVRDSSGNDYDIERQINDIAADIVVHGGGEYNYYRPEKATKNADTISNFLTEITSANELKIRKNTNGGLINYTFDKEMTISMISETKIISSKYSPFISGQRIAMTAEKSAFKIILADADDSKCVAVEDRKIYKEKLKSNLSLLDELKVQIEQEIEEDTLHLQFSEKEIEDIVKQIKYHLGNQSALLGETLEQKKHYTTEIDVLKSKLVFTNEIIDRFELHKENLLNDSSRLEFVLEGNYYLNQLVDVECPLCNSNISPEFIFGNTRTDNILIQDIESAYKSEFIKIQAQLIDIEKSIIFHKTEKHSLIVEINGMNIELEEIDKQLQIEIAPVVNVLTSELDKANSYKRELSRINEKHHSVRMLDIRISGINELINSPSLRCEYSKDVAEDEVSIYCDIIRKNLNDWNYGTFEEVTFNIDTLDISLDNKPRSSNGKGHRAILASVMVISLLEYAIQRDRIHPGFVVLDSPLLSLRERENLKRDEMINDNVTNSFYRSLATKENIQIIVLENKEPPKDIYNVANIIEFTGVNTIGRCGLV